MILDQSIYNAEAKLAAMREFCQRCLNDHVERSAVCKNELIDELSQMCDNGDDYKISLIDVSSPEDIISGCVKLVPGNVITDALMTARNKN